MQQRLAFRPHARIVRTLGDQLVSGESAALIELVKNSYDADASRCSVTIDPEADEIKVEDDGHGMSMADIQEKWVELGTDSKRRRSKSKSGGRKTLGSKGIGRLASAKLGRYLEIESTIAGKSKNESIKVTGIDWDSFLANGGKPLDEIEFFVEEVSAREKSGTLIAIKKISKVWTKKNLEKLILELRRLINPIKDDEGDFKVYLNLDGFKKNEKFDFNGCELVNGWSDYKNFPDNGREKNLIEPFPILDACDYTFKGKFCENKLEGIFTINDSRIDHKIEVEADKDVFCGSGIVNLNVFDRDAESIRSTFVKAGINQKDEKPNMNTKDARRYLDSLSGIAIYREDFRIRPYGDSDADWLGLNKRRVQNPSLHIEQAQISGLITVSSEKQSGLVERSSREGFEHNASYDSLKNLMLMAIEEIEKIRHAHNAKTGKNREFHGKTMKANFEKILKDVSLSNLAEFTKFFDKSQKEAFQNKIGNIKKSLEKFIEIANTRQAELEAKSTLGFIIAEVVHEIRNPTSSAGTSSSLLMNKIKINWKEKIDPEVTDILLLECEEIKECIAMAEDVLSRLDPAIQARSGKLKEFSVFHAVTKPLRLFDHKIKQIGVELSNIEPEGKLIIKGVEADLMTAIINLVDNALYWLSARKVENPFLKVRYGETHSHILITIEDNAGGVTEKYADSIFNVGFTEKPGGAGLGLSIAREALGRSGAFISHQNLEDGSLFKIEIGKDL